ncbi:nuclear transport factor 2 family protein [Streptomyces sp. NPDC051162]|uniref:YybH family protein n=1 Tax=unclassified Streptomyces TaxID=2593676 RepID=UPI0034158F7E
MKTAITDPAQLPSAFEHALNSNDVDGVLALFVPGATMRTESGEVITGPQALRQEISRTAAASGRLTNNSRHALVGADTALLVTDWTLEVTAPDGERVTRTGTTANVAHRGADGCWRFTVLNPLGTA